MAGEYLGLPIALNDVRERIETAKSQQSKLLDVTLIAVSKLKPKSMIIEAYQNGCRHFGENYVNELFDKAQDPLIVQNCPEIKWHFIGHLQSNKVNKLASGCTNLYMIQVIDSAKLAETVNKVWSRKPVSDPLNIMIQVNTSCEASKSGLKIEEVDSLVSHILSKCSRLKLTGLMTIGAPNHNLDLGPNPDYVALVECRDALNRKFGLDLQLSMGMSGDFEHAIALGSSYVRVGEKIFGPRNVLPSN